MASLARSSAVNGRGLVAASTTPIASSSRHHPTAASCSPQPRPSQTPTTNPPAIRSLSTTSAVFAKPRRTRIANDPFALRRMRTFQHDDVPTYGHLILERKRELLKYYRLAVLEMPKLQQFCQPYNPPPPTSPLRFRFVHFQGETHPATSKAVLTLRVDQLFSLRPCPLRSDAAKHKFLLLAGNRYDADAREVKVSCEAMPERAQNTKWCSDVIDAMIAEANTEAEAYANVPLDLRHMEARESKRKGFERRNAPSIADFPKEWLP